MWAVTIFADRSKSTQPATWIVYPLIVFVMSKSYRVADAAGASERHMRAATMNAPAIPSASRDMDEPRRRDGGWGQEGSPNISDNRRGRALLAASANRFSAPASLPAAIAGQA